MKNLKCKICLSPVHGQFEALVLKKYQAMFFHCKHCGFLFVEDPFWLKDAYHSPIAQSDTGLVKRNFSFAEQVAPLLFFLFGSTGAYADFAGGTGLFVRLMRDLGFDFFWHDLYCENMFARGFEYSAGQSPCNAVTAFEVLEHLVEPIGFIEECFQKTDASVLVFSTVVYQDEPPHPEDWWYYSLEMGQHISFFTRKTLSWIADRLNLDLIVFGSFYCFSHKSVSGKLERYRNSKLVRQIAKFRMQHALSSRIMDDNRQMLMKIGVEDERLK